jgi:hypothetical protein
MIAFQPCEGHIRRSDPLDRSRPSEFRDPRSVSRQPWDVNRPAFGVEMPSEKGQRLRRVAESVQQQNGSFATSELERLPTHDEVVWSELAALVDPSLDGASSSPPAERQKRHDRTRDEDR